MLSSLLNSQSKKRSSAVAVDFGQRTTKAVQIQRKGTGYELTQYCLLDAPSAPKGLTPEIVADHLKAVIEALNLKSKRLSLIVGVNDSIVRTAELPMIPVSDMRLMLKFNSKNYLQQDLPDYVFDCQTLALAGGEAGKPGQKAKVLVGGAKKQFTDTLVEGAKQAGLTVDEIVPGLVCPANAFEMAQPEVFTKEVIGLVDIGFRNTTISMFNNGEFVLNRVLAIGGDRITSGLADAMSISYAEAEGIKMGLPDEVQMILQTLLMPLGRELRASVDFFEHQQDKTVSHIYVSGGSARSQFIVECLQGEMMIQTKPWNPISFLELALPPQQIGEVEQVAPQLTVAVGGAMAAF